MTTKGNINLERPDLYELNPKIDQPKEWNELSPEERIIKNEETILKNLLISFKSKPRTYYSDILVRLIENELKEPRL